MRAALAVLAGGAAWLAAAPAWAHKPSDAQLRLAIDGDTITGRLDVAVRDLDGALGLDADGNGEITWRELSAGAPRITAYLERRLTLGADGAPCVQRLGAPALAELSDGAYWAVPISASCAHRPRSIDVSYALLFDIDSMHRGLLHVAGQTTILRDARPVRIELDETTSAASFVKEGVWHIWIGIDHILFLSCLIVPAVFQRRTRRWAAADSLRDVCREVFEIVTAFTLAHSITLVISAIGLVALPSRWVETAIALSVAAAALNNLLRTIDARWAVAFALGLLHGFGFSSVLIDLGLPSHELIGALLGFNLGVELGQAAIVVALLPVVFWIRRTVAYQALLWAGSATVAIVALLWSYQRYVA
ncbi:MAG: HupE/UreJ family protein [Deltaproteobacteria bacterium]|nr:MAG: HupE/UreJ family protein [Deltaproteobacteria bacterium]TMQ16988.1 MAG: HupE/UreJ family protein [Deltaproteobacteria bacterium]